MSIAICLAIARALKPYVRSRTVITLLLDAGRYLASRGLNLQRPKGQAKGMFVGAERRRKITAVHKANIMKMSDGLFLKCFKEFAQTHPEVETQNIVDYCEMKTLISFFSRFGAADMATHFT